LGGIPDCSLSGARPTVVRTGLGGHLPGRSAAHRSRSCHMGRVSQWAVRRPWYALLTWIGIVVVVGILGVGFGGSYNDNFNLPATESPPAQDRLETLTGGTAGTGAGLDGQVVWKAADGKVTDAESKAAMTALLTTLSTTPGVACVQTPFGAPLGTECPKAAAG